MAMVADSTRTIRTRRKTIMLKKLIPVLALAAAITGPAAAQNVTYTKDIAPIMKENCSECHGASAPIFKEFKKQEEKFTKEKIGPRMDSYPELITYIGWPETGAIMRRLDDGKASPGGKPGNYVPLSRRRRPGAPEEPCGIQGLGRRGRLESQPLGCARRCTGDHQGSARQAEAGVLS